MKSRSLHRRVAWRCALIAWWLHLDRLGNWFEDVAWPGELVIRDGFGI